MAALVLAITAISVGCSNDKVITEDTLFAIGDSIYSEERNQQSEIEEPIPNVDAEKSIFVYICGAVNSPGVYELPAGSRGDLALERAGGFKDDADREYVNLAAILFDGQRIYFPYEYEVEIMDTESAGSAYPVNINTAKEEELCKVPGIGPSKAEAIVAYRIKYGAFQCTEDIMNVAGIGESTYSKIKEYISVL